MSKNVSVKEGNIARKFRPVDRLNVITDNEQGMWKPESAFKLGTLHVSENGIYIASLNGYAAYSEIDVRVTDKLGSDDPDSYDYITPDPENYPDVWNPDTEDWDEAELNDPDEWKLPEEFDEDSLDTGDLDESEFDPYDPENSLDDFDPSDLDTSNIKLEDPKLPKETKLKGIDPDTGAETEVTATDVENEEGEIETLLSTETLPDAIHIVIPPRKLDYNNLETIDFSGIHVYLLNSDHRLYKSEQYPTGEIPFDELIFPESMADASEATDPEYDYGEYRDTGSVKISSAGSVMSLISEELGYFKYGYEDPYGCIALIETVVASSDGVHPCIGYSYNGDDSFEGISPFGVIVFYTLNVGDTVTLGRQYPAFHYYTYGKMKKEDVMVISQEYMRETNWNIYSGQKEGTTEKSTLNAEKVNDGGQVIPVQWARSDGEILEDSFTITVYN